MKFLVIGLGNPGVKYENTRHNIGFKVLDALASASNAVFGPDRYADVCQIKHKGRTFILVKPTTFMNLSGKAVNYWMKKENISIDNLLVVTDDIALPYGKLRMKPKGSDGGHNGLKDIQHTINTTKYPRLRFGVGNDFYKGQQANYVLGEWSPEETSDLNAHIERAAEMVLSFGSIGIQHTMNQYN